MSWSCQLGGESSRGWVAPWAVSEAVLTTRLHIQPCHRAPSSLQAQGWKDARETQPGTSAL